jgi:hypothetical protein
LRLMTAFQRMRCVLVPADKARNRFVGASHLGGSLRRLTAAGMAPAPKLRSRRLTSADYC